MRLCMLAALVACGHSTSEPIKLDAISVSTEMPYGTNGYSVKVKFDATATSKPPARAAFYAHYSCQVGSKRLAHDVMSGSDLDRIAVGETLRTDLIGWFVQPLEGKPSRCEITLALVEHGNLRGAKQLARVCWDGTHTRSGACS